VNAYFKVIWYERMLTIVKEAICMFVRQMDEVGRLSEH
jgi:hypothetical protein